MARVYTGLDVQGDQGGTFPWASKRIDVGGGVHQAVVDEGPKDSPVTFLLLHGNPTWGYLYRRFLAHLSPRYRCIAVDHVGFGRSDKPRDPSYYTLERHVANLETTLAALKARNVVVVVQDWGGPVGMGWATRHAEDVAGVVVLNTWAFLHDPPMKIPFLFRLLVLGKGGWRRVTRKNLFTELFLLKGGARKLTEVEKDAYRAPHPTPDDRVGVGRWPQLIPETAKPQHESWATMDAIEKGLEGLRTKPALIVWAMKDPAFRKAALDRWTRTFDRVDGPHRLPEAKHYLQEDAPEAILARIDAWLPTVLPAVRGRGSNGAKPTAKKAVARAAR